MENQVTKIAAAGPLGLAAQFLTIKINKKRLILHYSRTQSASDICHSLVDFSRLVSILCSTWNLQSLHWLECDKKKIRSKCYLSHFACRQCPLQPFWGEPKFQSFLGIIMCLNFSISNYLPFPLRPYKNCLSISHHLPITIKIVVLTEQITVLFPQVSSQRNREKTNDVTLMCYLNGIVYLCNSRWSLRELVTNWP